MQAAVSWRQNETHGAPSFSASSPHPHLAAPDLDLDECISAAGLKPERSSCSRRLRSMFKPCSQAPTSRKFEAQGFFGAAELVACVLMETVTEISWLLDMRAG